MSFEIYHNPRCKKSRAGLQYLSLKTTDFKIYEYLKEGLTRKQLKEILLKTNLKPVDLVRTQEEYFKKELKDKTFTDDEWINIIIENPKILHRPIIIGRHKAIIAEPPEKTELMLK
jgi:arsenate reductase (glutaredoxin)